MNDRERAARTFDRRRDAEQHHLVVGGRRVCGWRGPRDIADGVRAHVQLPLEELCGEVHGDASARAARIARAMGREDFAREILGSGHPPADAGGALEEPRT